MRVQEFVSDTEAASAYLTEYFALDNRGVPRFTGARFDDLAHTNGADPEPHVITEADLLAVELLSVRVPAEAALWLLGPGRNPVSALLAEIPTDVDLHTAAARHTDSNSPAWRLWDVLRKEKIVRNRKGRYAGGLGPVTTSKLMARKRPRLIPVRDSVVKRALAPPSRSDFWQYLRGELTEEVVEKLTRLHERACDDSPTVPRPLALLRVLDIVIWMPEHSRAAANGPASEALAR